jgi:hypothetical protein
MRTIVYMATIDTVPLASAASRIVRHTNELDEALVAAACEAREAIVALAADHPLVAEASVLEGKSATGEPRDVTLSHTVSISAGGILVSVLATASLGILLDEAPGGEW